MDLGATSLVDDLAQIVQPDSATRKHFNSPARTVNELLDERQGFRRAVLMAAGQHAGYAETDELFQCSKRIRGDIKGTVEYSLVVADEFTKAFTSLQVHRAACCENAEDDAISAVLNGEPGIAYHDGKLGVGVAEAAFARAEHNHDRYLQPCFGFSDSP